MKKFGVKMMVALVAVLTVVAPVLTNQVGACAVIFGETPIPDCLKEAE